MAAASQSLALAASISPFAFSSASATRFSASFRSSLGSAARSLVGNSRQLQVIAKIKATIPKAGEKYGFHARIRALRNTPGRFACFLGSLPHGRGAAHETRKDNGMSRAGRQAKRRRGEHGLRFCGTYHSQWWRLLSGCKRLTEKSITTITVQVLVVVLRLLLHTSRTPYNVQNPLQALQMYHSICIS